MIVQVIFLIVGFLCLIKGSDFFVDGASSYATNLKISKAIIGITLVAFATSIPEFAVSINSIVVNEPDFVIGNVIGTNIINVLFILGIASIFMPLRIKKNTIKKEIPYLVILSSVLVFLLIEKNLIVGNINRFDSIIVIILFAIFGYYIYTIIRDKKHLIFFEKPKYSKSKSILLVVIGLIAVIIGSNLVVNNAVIIARYFNISDRIIGLTVIAFGTSLPEISTTFAAIRKKEQDILVENIIGSNILNICLILGLPVLVFGTLNGGNFRIIDVLFLIISVVVLFLFSKDDRVISRKNGFVMLLLFFVYYGFVIFS